MRKIAGDVTGETVGLWIKDQNAVWKPNSL